MKLPLALLALPLLAATVGCQNSGNAGPSDYDKLSARVHPLESENTALNQQLRDAQARQAAPQTAPAAVNTTGLEGLDTRYNPQEGTLTVTLPDRVLFDPGQATLKTSSRSTLNRVATAIKTNYAGKRVYVDGHTDTDPIRASKWSNNHDLGAARGMAVANYLMKAGIRENNVVVRSYGAIDAKGSKDASRRVEIVVQTK